MKRLALTVLVLGLAFAPAAGAASWLDPGGSTYVPVADGVIEHTAYDYELVRDGVRYLEGQRLEMFVASDRSRNVTFHPNGSLTSEDVVIGDEWRHFTAETNVLRIHKARYPGRPVVANKATQGAILREQVEAGWLKVEKQTTWGGRPALVLVDGPNDPDHGYNSERLTVDARSYVELEGQRWATGFSESGQRSELISRRRLVIDETLDRSAAAAQLEMLPHPSAEIRGGEDTAFSAKKKAKPRSKSAKRKAKRARRAKR